MKSFFLLRRFNLKTQDYRMFSSQSSNDLHTVYVALGSNLGNQTVNIYQALDKLKTLGNVKKTGFLYRSKPMYYLNQPSFLNTACLMETSLSAEALLVQLKRIEKEIGRQENFRNGPRIIDLDIILYDDKQISTENLQIPHPRLHERAFVLNPLLDISPNLIHPQTKKTINCLHNELADESKRELTQVIPCINQLTKKTRYLVLNSGLPLLMGILNVTPDSFSDGGVHNSSVEVSVEHALELLHNGAHIIDIGGESTRPNSETIDVNAEINRVVPVIRGIREKDLNCIISIDTRKAAVAKAAVEAGADIVNDVSGGSYDSDMIPFVSAHRIPYVVMHMRGDPSTMLKKEFSSYENVADEVVAELKTRLSALNSNFFPKWLQIIDPGIGFAKGYQENMQLLNPATLLRLKESLDSLPLLVGLSRKRFFNQLQQNITQKRRTLIVDEDGSTDLVGSNSEKLDSIPSRDLYTAAGCCISILGGADIIRVHNVQEVRQITDTFSAMLLPNVVN